MRAVTISAAVALIVLGVALVGYQWIACPAGSGCGADPLGLVVGLLLLIGGSYLLGTASQG